MEVILSTLGVKMNKSSKHKTWTTVAIVTLLLIAIGAHAGSREFKDRGIKSRYGRGFVEKSFTVSGPFVGTLDGRISMVGSDLKLDKGVGTCGKEGQSVPVGVGQPTLKIDEITVGGTA